VTYVVVVFSIVVQGLTIKPLFRRYLPAESIIAAAREQPR
jgi:NhaP-type Na+/H+ or K+/H+ antiporter